MELRLIHVGLLLLSLGVLLVAANEHEHADQRADGSISSPARASFSLPKMFDFGRFKRLFNKHYDSLVQEMARQKLFLARAFAAFVSAVNYKYRKSDYHLAINQMSDQTPEEMAQRSNRLLSQSRSLQRSHTNKIEVADESDVERELENILRNKDNEAGLKEAAEELVKSTRSRRKRDASGETRDISLDDLIGRPHVPAKNPKIVRTVPSNNPDYEPLELMSYGADDGAKQSEIPDSEASFINRLPGSQFLGSMRGRLVAAFRGGAEVANSGSLKGKGRSSEPDEVFVDHRQSNCFFEPRDQKECGSCYAFSTVALLEWTHCTQTGKLVAFSEQYLIDCGFRFGMTGCNGGREPDVIDYVNKYGLELGTNFPYRGAEGTCPYPRETDPKSMGWLKARDLRIHEVGPRILEKSLKRGPLLVHIEIPPDFGGYKAGIHAGKKCDPDQLHSMLLVGSGRQDGREYWLFRNSYGTDWGEDGYFRLNKDSKCFTADMGVWALSTKAEGFARENSNYQAFKLTRAHEARDPDAPEDDEPISGPVHKV